MHYFMSLLGIVVAALKHQTMAAVKEKLATVGITIFPTRVDDPLWDEIRQSVTPPLTLLEMIALKNESFLSSSASTGNYCI